MIFNIKDIYINNTMVISNIFWRTIQIFTKQLVLFAVFIFCAYFLSAYDFGKYNYILSIVVLLVAFSDFGLSVASSKFVVDYLHSDKNKLAEILISILFVILSISVVLIVLFFTFGKFIFIKNYQDIMFLLPLIFLIPATSLLDGLYRGLNRFKTLSSIVFICSLISVVVIFFSIKYYGLRGAYFSQIFYYAILFISLIFKYNEVSFKVNTKLIKEVLRYSAIIGFANIGFFFYSRVDMLFLGHYGFIKEVGYFEIINKILIFILTPLSVITAVIAPVNTRLFNEGKFDLLLRKFKRYFVISIILSVIISAALLIMYKPVFAQFSKFNSPEMLTIAQLMTIVFFTQILNSLFPDGFAIPTGYARISMYLLLIFGTLNVILDYFLINLFGYIGVVYATILTKCTTDILFIIIYYRSIYKLNLNK